MSSTSDFIQWNGGEMPVPPLTHIFVKFRGEADQSWDSRWTSDELFYSQSLDWEHNSSDSSEFDVVAYKVADVQPVFQTWTGGSNPAGDTIVEYILRDSPNEVNSTYANNLDWEHVAGDPDYDIILYRIID